MVWFVCKMRLRHMCTFASENLTVKGLMYFKTFRYGYISTNIMVCHLPVLVL